MFLLRYKSYLEFNFILMEFTNRMLDKMVHCGLQQKYNSPIQYSSLKTINELLFWTLSVNGILYKDIQYYSQAQQILENYHNLIEYTKKFKALTQNEQAHPIFFTHPLCDLYHQWKHRKRKSKNKNRPSIFNTCISKCQQSDSNLNDLMQFMPELGHLLIPNDRDEQPQKPESTNQGLLSELISISDITANQDENSMSSNDLTWLSLKEQTKKKWYKVNIYLNQKPRPINPSPKPIVMDVKDNFREKPNVVSSQKEIKMIRRNYQTLWITKAKENINHVNGLIISPPPKVSKIKSSKIGAQHNSKQIETKLIHEQTRLNNMIFMTMCPFRPQKIIYGGSKQKRMLEPKMPNLGKNRLVVRADKIKSVRKCNINNLKSDIIPAVKNKSKFSFSIKKKNISNQKGNPNQRRLKIKSLQIPKIKMPATPPKLPFCKSITLRKSFPSKIKQNKKVIQDIVNGKKQNYHTLQSLLKIKQSNRVQRRPLKL